MNRVAVVAGPDPGHAFPALALAARLQAAGDQPLVFTGGRWLGAATDSGLSAQLLKGLAPRPEDDDRDAGQRIHQRAAHVCTELLPQVLALRPQLVVSDVLTAGGGLAAELAGVPWVELSPHPLYEPSKGLPPIGSGLAPGIRWRGRARDAVLRALTSRAIRQGMRQRSAARVGLGLPARDPGPAARLIATLPALEVSRPDWPGHAHLVGPLHWEPTTAELPLPPGTEPLVVVAPSTAGIGVTGMAEMALAALDGMGVRAVISMLDAPPAQLPPWATAGLGRQDLLLPQAAVVIGGGGHGLLAKSLAAGVPLVVIPGGGDQWELANRVVRQGSAILVRPPTTAAVRAAVRRILTNPSYRAAAEAAAATGTAVADPVEVCHSVLADGARSAER